MPKFDGIEYKVSYTENVIGKKYYYVDVSDHETPPMIHIPSIFNLPNDKCPHCNEEITYDDLYPKEEDA